MVSDGQKPSIASAAAKEGVTCADSRRGSRAVRSSPAACLGTSSLVSSRRRAGTFTKPSTTARGRAPDPISGTLPLATEAGMTSNRALRCRGVK